ncbi:toxin A [Clostridium puniceum]|uniref:Toxin A n=1 Tax=Clostridium puniceum TaxID=29367 RepID=A0A1S8TWS0_9CLOT|nr:leucine-rich repeat domain-containing protein [Clostridium puniceum]OOM82160.1 toxin A [Clostridium puniceum]
MQQNKLKKLAMLCIILCINSIPAVAYAKEIETTKEITKQSNVESKVQIEDNWLTKEVSSQVGKNVKNLTEQDFLNIKKIKLSYKNIKDEIPKEIKLLKNLEYLDLNYSAIEGEIPEELGDLPKLTYLDLGDNKIEKLPDNIKQKAANGNYTYCDFEENKFTLSEGWYLLKSKWCYLDRNGERIKGTKKINGKEYEFTDDGNVREGWESDKSKNWYYYDREKGMIKNDWKQVSGKWYYFNEDGIMQKGLQVIKGVKYYLSDNGVMLTGWVKVDNNYCYFSGSGAMQYGWLEVDNKTYYLDDSTGAMLTATEKVINGKKYKFSTDGSLLRNVWLDGYNYVQANGEAVNTYYNYSHSNANYQLFKYMTDVNNQMSVDNTAVWLHGGATDNNCVFFSSEALRRIGVNIPRSVANTYQFENELKSRGFAYSYDFSQIKPGDIVFTNNYTHVYIFMCWDKNGYAYIVDNQRTSYGNLVLHRRKVLEDTAISDRATHFFYYPS